MWAPGAQDSGLLLELGFSWSLHSLFNPSSADTDDMEVPLASPAREETCKTLHCLPHHRSSSCERGERRRNRPRPSFASAPASLQAGWPANGHAA